MNKFLSLLAPDITAYITYQKASGRWSRTYEINMVLFDKHCYSIFPQENALTQEMVDSWCNQRPTESVNSCRARTGSVISFVRYLQAREKAVAIRLNTLKPERCTYIPHAFAESELENFFRACDSLPAKPKRSDVLTNKVIIPAFFRLLYSSGLRTNEARMLCVSDVNFEQGVLNVSKSKGASQHFVVIHDSMLALLKECDSAMRKIYPVRKYFFPASESRHITRSWVVYHFRKIWDGCNTSHATAYNFRHNYATENINQWVGCGFGFDSKLVYLSKSMGHSVLKSTQYYYSLVPAMADILEEHTAKSFDDIVPEVDYAEIH